MGLAALRGDAAAVRGYFEGKVVWVTGASGGLGEALCFELCRSSQPRGLVLSARRAPELERVRRRCQELLPEVQIATLPLDLAALAELPAKAEAASRAFGRVDVLVNNGGVGFRGLASETGLELDQEVMNVDYFSGVALVKALLPAWLAACSGHVVQISSVQGFFGLPGRTAYSAAKHAAVGFYDSLRAELADTGVLVTVVCPGYVRTGHSLNAVRASSLGYPEGHSSKGVAPEDMAREVLLATARRKPELLSAAPDAKLARLLRTLWPPLLFWIMQRRARKEMQQRRSEAEGPAAEPLKGSKQS